MKNTQVKFLELNVTTVVELTNKAILKVNGGSGSGNGVSLRPTIGRLV